MKGVQLYKDSFLISLNKCCHMVLTCCKTPAREGEAAGSAGPKQGPAPRCSSSWLCVQSKFLNLSEP